MSSKILGNVWDACAAYGVKGAKLMIMARLADYSNDDGVCYPGVETICRQLGLGESTVRTAISELEADGWLTR
ncbi:TPA: helix-turn-helix domain-containing protein, partial [Escherichia coli]|nr:helix-turn-helix domain-containing protein [Escherichia coli]